MQATDTLRQEHRAIELVLDQLDRLAGQAEAGEGIDRQTAERALDILRNFADRCHHGKEEGHLFPALADRGFPRDSGPVAVMLHEHEAGRAHLGALAAALPGALGGDQAASRAFAEHARAYTALLRAHIGKEDTVLFPLAERALGEADDRQLTAAFDALEEREIGPGVHEQYHCWIEEMVAATGRE